MLFPAELLAFTRTAPLEGCGRAAIPASWPGFAGHFPGNPVVPLYVLIGLVRATGERTAGERLEIERVERVKLTAPVAPDEEVVCEVGLEREPPGLRARATLFSARGPKGSVVLRLTPVQDA